MDKQKNIKLIIRLTIVTILSSFLYTLGIKCFVQVDGVNLLASGLGGICVILSRVIIIDHISKDLLFSIFYIGLNIPIVIIAYKKIGKLYAIFTGLNLIITSILNVLIPSTLFSFMNLDPSSDLLLIAVCSGMLSGISSGLSLKEGLSTGGVDTIVTYLGIIYNKQAGSLSIYVNAAIILTGGILFNKWVSMLYTIILIFVAGEMINIIYRRTKKKMISIITNKPEEMSKAFIEISKHGVTIFKCKGAYSNTEKYEVKTVVLESEAKTIIETANKIDNSAFITILNVHDVNGPFTMPDIK